MSAEQQHGQTAVEQLLALELAREERRKRNLRALGWTIAGLVALAFFIVPILVLD